ncbi:hypothetical protein D6C80_05442 [Aureobasidium pullulans]|nr:hypothetical protein D6C80_05442 [Aureobasidium pullulans]
MQTSVPVDNEFDDSISRSPRAQGVKRDHAEENPQAPNKAARPETITKRDGPLSDFPSQSASPSGTSRPEQVESLARAIHEQRLPLMNKILATAPAPVRSPAYPNGSLPFAAQMNGQPPGPLRFHDTNQVPSDSSLQNTSAAQPLPANFDHNISRMDVPVQNSRMAQVLTYSQASANGNAVSHTVHDDQIGPYPQAPFHTARLPSRPPPPHPCLHDVNLLSSIAQSLASLSKEKVLEILATAAMHHADIYATIQKELAQEAVGKHATQSSLFKHLAAQSRDEYRAAADRDNAIAAAYAAQAVQNQQRQQYQQYQQYQQNLQPGVIENKHNQVEEEVEEESEDEQEEEEEEEPLTFAQNTNRVEYILHTRYAGLRDSQQSYIIVEAATKIEDQIESIASQVRNTSPFETKSEAVFELCNIGRLVVQQTNGYLGSKIQDHMSYSSVLVSSLQALCCKLEEREMMAIGRMWKNDLEQLDKEREGCFEGFDVVVEQFRQAAAGMREGGPKRSGAATIDLTG